jgi:hypothetical protein
MKKRRIKTLYQCPVCMHWYKEKEWAKKCEIWCKEHKSCNLEIIKHSIKLSTDSSLDKLSR